MRRRLDFEAIFEASPNPYMVVDRELRYVAANPAYLRVTRRQLDTLIGKRVTDEFPHDPEDSNNDSARRLLDSLRRVLESGEPDVLPLIHYRIGVDGPNGIVYEDRYWSATHTPLLDVDGGVQFVLQHTVDVTALHTRDSAKERPMSELPLPQVEAGIWGRTEEVQQRNQALDQDLKRLLRVFEQAPGFLCFLRGPEHVFELTNAAYNKLVGGRELIGLTSRQALPEVDDGYHELLDQVYRTAEPFVGRAMSFRLRQSENGPLNQVFANFVYQPILDANGRSFGVLVFGIDITQQVRAEADEAEARSAADRARAELEAIFECFPEALFVGDVSGLKRANAAARDILGYDSIDQVQRQQPSLVRELSPRSAITGVPVTAEETPFARALRGEASRMELVIEHWKSKAERYVLSSGAPIRVGGAITGAVVTQVDITEQKRAQTEALQLAKVLDEMRDFVGIADPTGRPIFANRAALALVGLPDVKAASERLVSDYFVERQRRSVLDDVIPAALRDGYWEGELLFLHQTTHEEIPVLYSLFPLRDAAGNVTALATITRDLRLQKIADAERAELLRNEKAARAQAEQANQLKDQFLATVSHELRTPLAAILGWMGMLRTGMLSVEKQARALETIERNARIQARLIDDLLDVSRIISGKLSLEIEQVDVAAIVVAAVETVLPVAEAKGIHLDVNVDFTGRVPADARRLQQVIWNLLSNAVKFTPKGGEVGLRVEARGDWVEIVVSDTGAGIAPEFLPHVFERFSQSDTGPARKMGGLGLGLSIVRHVVSAHGGEVSASSEGPGQGAMFSVRLPISSSWSSELRASAGAETPLEPPAAIEGMRVLVVDDEEDVREYLRSLLQQWKIEAIVASSAAEALSEVQRKRPDLVLADLGMPVEDGKPLMQRIRALAVEQGGETPAVALIAYARLDDGAQVMLAGFQNHVTKPIDAGELLAVVASFAKGSDR